MNETLNELLPFIPEHWRPKVVILLAASPYITRALQALRTGGGVKGMLSSIWLGTNTDPKVTAAINDIKAATQTISKP